MQSTNNSSASNIFLKSRVYSIKDHRSLMSKTKKERGLQTAPITIFFQEGKKFVCLFLDYVVNETLLNLKTRVLSEIDGENKLSAIRTRVYHVIYKNHSVYPDIDEGELENDAFINEKNAEYFILPIRPKPIKKSISYSDNCVTSQVEPVMEHEDTYNLEVKIDGIEYKQKYFSDCSLSVLLRSAMYIKIQKHICPSEKFYNFYIKQKELSPVDPTESFSYYFNSLRVKDEKELYEHGVLEVLIELKDMVELELMFPNLKKMVVKVNPLFSLSRLLSSFHSSIGTNYDLFIGNSDVSLSLEQQICELESASLLVKHKIEKLTGFGDMDEAERLLEKNEIEDNEEMEYNIKFNLNKGSLKDGKITYKNRLFTLSENRRSLVFSMKKGSSNQIFSGNDVAEITQDNCDDSFIISIINNKGKIETFTIYTESIETKNKIIGKILLLK